MFKKSSTRARRISRSEIVFFRPGSASAIKTTGVFLGKIGDVVLIFAARISKLALNQISFLLLAELPRGLYHM